LQVWYADKAFRTASGIAEHRSPCQVTPIH